MSMHKIVEESDEFDTATLNDKLIALRATGIVRIVAEFGGGGDEGHMQSVACYGPVESMNPDVIDAPPMPGYPHTGRRTLSALFNDLLYDIFAGIVDFDWVNNEGGGGTLTIEPFSGLVSVDAYQNVMSTEEFEFDQSIENDLRFTPLTEQERDQLDARIVAAQGR